MPKAERDGVYRLNGHHFKTKKGAVLPEGAELIEATEQRKQDAAPENKSKAGAPENRAKKGE